MILRSVADEEAVRLLDRRFRFIHAMNLGPARSLPQHSGQFVQLFRIACGVYLHVSVIAIAYPSTDPQRLGSLLDEVAESDTLYAPAHPVQPC